MPAFQFRTQRLWAILQLLIGCVALLPAGAASGAEPVIPVTTTVALDEHPVVLPRDLSTPATVLILGFGRHSQEATTAWERPIRLQLARPGSLEFFDMAMLAEVPGFLRPLVLRRIRHEVPDVLKPRFLPLTGEEDAWKRVAAYAPDQPDAAYVLLVDRAGRVRWSTHAPFSSTLFARLGHEAATIAGAGASR